MLLKWKRRGLQEESRGNALRGGCRSPCPTLGDVPETFSGTAAPAWHTRRCRTPSAQESLLMPSTHRHALALLVLLAINGCGTVATLSDHRSSTSLIYSGTRFSWTHPCTGGDVPFSAVADTLALPYTIPA